MTDLDYRSNKPRLTPVATASARDETSSLSNNNSRCCLHRVLRNAESRSNLLVGEAIGEEWRISLPVGEDRADDSIASSWPRTGRRVPGHPRDEHYIRGSR